MGPFCFKFTSNLSRLEKEGEADSVAIMTPSDFQHYCLGASVGTP